MEVISLEDIVELTKEDIDEALKERPELRLW